MRLPTRPVQAALISALFLTLQPCPAFADDADDRTAGTMYRAKPRAEIEQEQAHQSIENTEEPAIAAEPAVEAEHPVVTRNVNYDDLESIGLLTQVNQGSLGRDMWRGSSRTTIAEKLPEIPALAEYRTMQRLAYRLLLTKTDAGLVRGGSRPEAGGDLTTLRMEKLLEMGAYKEAFSLYTMIHGTPYHERIARLGILAALYNRESALACLETESIGKQFQDVAFWQQMSKICTYILTKESGKADRSATFPENRILEQIVQNDSFRYKPSRLEDMHDLQPLEAAILAAEKRFDFSGLTIDRNDHIPPHVINLMIGDPSMPEEQSFKLYIRSVEMGLTGRADLEKYYETKAVELFGKDKTKTSLAGYAAVSGWRRLPYIYRAATNAPGDAERRTIIREALGLAQEYGNAALWPLADVIAGVDPSAYSKASIRTALTILAETATDAGKSWQAAVTNDVALQNSPLALTIIKGVNLSPEKIANNDGQDAEKDESLENGGNPPAKLLEIAYEKLDNTTKLHNISASDAYEKLTGLTSTVDYVMPYAGLLEDLNRAESEQRLGEIILLSSIALRDTPPAHLEPGMFGEIIDGLLTVGLTKEAQMLANEVILGLSVK